MDKLKIIKFMNRQLILILYVGACTFIITYILDNIWISNPDHKHSTFKDVDILIIINPTWEIVLKVFVFAPFYITGMNRIGKLFKNKG